MHYSTTMKGKEVTMLCQICEKCSSKYKCPSCYLLYCSLACFKSHKDQLCEAEARKRNSQTDQSNKNSSIHQNNDDHNDENDSEDEDRLSPKDLEKLGKCDITKQMLKNKHLREILEGVDKAQDPEAMLKNVMDEPIFTEFVDHCLGVVESRKEKNEK